MRELEFLPTWYHQTRRRKRIVAIEGYIVAGLILVLGGWVAPIAAFAAREISYDVLQQQLDTAFSKEQLLNTQIVLRQQLQEREELIASLGYPVEMTRLLHTLDAVMPKEMTLLELDCQTREVARPVSTVAAILKPTDKKQVDRRLDVKLKGVAPSDGDLANFLSELQRRPFFEQLNVTYAQEKIDSGHIMREFEVTFSMSLNQ